ncbi:hypothetical protein Tco_0768033 [Tanacetum coccineum]
MTVYKADEYVAMKQVFPVEDYQDKISQRLIEAAHVNDNKVAFECLADPFVDVNYVALTGKMKPGQKILELLLEGGASQLACEEALLEASHLGLAKSAKALMASELNELDAFCR